MTPTHIHNTLDDALRLDLVGPDPEEPTHADYATKTLRSGPPMPDSPHISTHLDSCFTGEHGDT